MRLRLALDFATATEAAAVARAVEGMGVGFSIGVRLLIRSGSQIVTSVRPFGPVMADARLGGGSAAVAGAARSLAASGAGTIVLGPGNGPAVVDSVLDAVEPYGAGIAVAAVHPDGPAADLDLVTHGSGRGKVVSRVAAALVGTGVEILGIASDVGVVAQVAPDLGVIAWGVRTVEQMTDAIAGAAGVVLDAGAIDGSDAVRWLGPFVEAADGG